MTEEHKATPAFPDARTKKLSDKRSIWLITLFSIMIFGLGGGLLSGDIGHFGIQNDNRSSDGLRAVFLMMSLGVGFRLCFS